MPGFTTAQLSDHYFFSFHNPVHKENPGQSSSTQNTFKSHSEEREKDPKFKERNPLKKPHHEHHSYGFKAAIQKLNVKNPNSNLEYLKGKTRPTSPSISKRRTGSAVPRTTHTQLMTLGIRADKRIHLGRTRVPSRQGSAGASERNRVSPHHMTAKIPVLKRNMN